MKSKLVLVSILLASCFSAIYAQEIIVTSTAGNTVASKTQIDLPLLNGNPNAMIVATPLGNSATLNPHPIGAWYYNNKWNIFNVDHAVMPLGLQFKVEYFIRSDANHFLHVVTVNNAGGYSFIDNPALNNNPTAQVRIFQNHAPDFRAFYLNQNEVRIVYDANVGKWYIENINGKALQPNTAYNVVVSGTINVPKTAAVIPELNTNTQNSSTCNCPIPTSLPPDGNAGGDLGGVFPNPTVQKLNGKPVSNNTPTVGQVLKWNGTAWQPADDNVASTNSITTPASNKPTFLYFEQSTGGNQPQINSFNPTAIIPGLDNKFFTLTQNSRVVFHTSVSLLNTDTTPFGSGGVGKVLVQILTNTSNSAVATEQSFTPVFPNTTVSSNSTGFVILPAGTYYTKVSIAKYVDTPFKAIGGRLLIEIFPE